MGRYYHGTLVGRQTARLGRGNGASNFGDTASCYRWERVHRLRRNTIIVLGLAPGVFPICIFSLDGSGLMIFIIYYNWYYLFLNNAIVSTFLILRDNKAKCSAGGVQSVVWVKVIYYKYYSKRRNATKARQRLTDADSKKC